MLLNLTRTTVLMANTFFGDSFDDDYQICTHIRGFGTQFMSKFIQQNEAKTNNNTGNLFGNGKSSIRTISFQFALFFSANFHFSRDSDDDFLFSYFNQRAVNPIRFL